MFYYLKNLTGCKPLQILRISPKKYLHDGVKGQSSNGGIKWIAGGWTLFLAENVILSENREWICEKYGEKLYHGVYNTLSSAACISILFGYFKHKGQGIKWAKFGKGSAPVPLRISSVVLQSFGMICFSQLLPKFQIPIALEKGNEIKETTQQHSADYINADASHSKPEVVSPPSESKAKFAFKARCPMDFRGKSDLPLDAIYGVERITRHPNLWALASLGVGTALVTPFVIESLFFAGPILLATFGTAHQDSRFRRNMGGTLSPEKERITSNIPFLALVTGKQDWEKLGNEIKWLNCGLATIIVLALHVI
jgi:hypothetical protein